MAEEKASAIIIIWLCSSLQWLWRFRDWLTGFLYVTPRRISPDRVDNQILF